MSRINPKINEFQKREAPINYSNLAINSLGELVAAVSILEKRESLLKDRIVQGYGVIWGSRNDYGEKFVKGCFAKSISEQGPDANSTYQIKFRDRHGNSCALFVELTEDEIGLYFKTKPLDKVKWCDDLLVQLESGTINNFSIGFKHMWDKVEWDEEDDSLINLEARLFEISAVDIPSDLKTYAVRSHEEPEYLRDDVEDFILSLPKSKHLEARKIFTRCMTLDHKEPTLEERKLLLSKKPPKTGLDLNYLISKF